MNTSVVGLDIAKNVFHLYTIKTDGKVLKKVLKRRHVLEFFANYPRKISWARNYSASYWFHSALKKS